MLCLIIDLDNILLLFSIQLTIIIFFILLVFKFLKVKEDLLNLYFIQFFKLFITGNIILTLFLNFIIINLNGIIVIIFYIISIFFYCIALAHLNIVNSLILKSTITYTKSQINRYLKLYGVFLLLGMIIIVILLYNTSFNSDYFLFNVYFFLLLYSLAYVVIFSILPHYKKIQIILKKIKNLELKLYFQSFFKGIFGLYSIILLEYFSIFLYFSIFKIILYILMLSSVYWLYLVYKGLNKRLKKEN